MSPFHVKNKVCRGFSLVEMVIIVAVIAIIAAIAIPTFSHIAQDAEVSELKSQLNDAYSKFANAQRGDGYRVDPISSYRFVKADSVNGGTLVNATEVHSWDGESENVDTQDFTELGFGEYLYPDRYGEFYVIRKGTR